MKGLIIKDILTIRSTLKIYFTIFALYGFISIVTKNPSFFTSIVAVMLAMLPITALGYDDRAKFNQYALTMPINRDTIVFAKYALGFLVAALGFILNFVVLLFDAKTDLIEKLSISFSAILIGLVFQAFVLPIMFKLGVERGRIAMVITFAIPSVLIFMGIYAIEYFNINIASLPIISLLIGFLVLFILMYILSLALSIKIVRKKVW